MSLGVFSILEQRKKGSNRETNVGQVTWILLDEISALVPVGLQGPHSHPHWHLVDQLLSWSESHMDTDHIGAACPEQLSSRCVGQSGSEVNAVR